MSALAGSTSIADMVVSTLSMLDKRKWTDLSSDLRRFTFSDQLLDEKKRKYSDGITLTTNITYRNNGQAAFVSLGQLDDYNFVDVAASGTLPWKYAKWDYAYDERLIAQNSGESQILDYVKIQRNAGLMSNMELFEASFWIGSPVAGDNESPCSINSHIVWNATESTEGVPTGGNATGSTAGFILDSTDTRWNTKWKNFSFTYANPTIPDLVSDIRNGMEFSDFYSPSKIEGVPTNTRPERGLYCNYATMAPLEVLADNRNQNLGSDLATHDGDVFIRKIPVKSVPKLAGRTTSMPFYGINWNEIYPCYLEGWYMKMGALRRAPLQYNMITQRADTQYNVRAVNRRGSFIVAKSDPVLS